VKPLPLRTSLTLAYAAILSLVLTALGFGYHSALVRQLDSSTTAQLEDKARGLHGYLQFRNGAPALAYNEDDPEEVALINDATRYFQVYDGNTGTLLTQSPGMESLGLRYTAAEVREFRRTPELQDIQTDRGRLRLFTSVISPTPSEAYVVQVGELLDRVDAMLAGFDRLLLWRILAGLAFAAVAGRWLAGRSLAPLSQLAEATRAIGITNLHDRLSVRGANDELDQVANAFNHALARVEQSVGEMRQFSAALAHELRTPLAILRGEAELALTQTPSAAERERLVSQIDEYDRLTRLINQILTLARAEAGEISMDRQSMDLSALGSAVVEQIEPVAAARDITLTCDILPDVIVEGDAGWLERLLLILLDNAIKFTPESGRISVALSSASNMARLSIADSGIGIAPEAIPRLFERFYRADASRSRQTDGAGLGLALAKWIAQRHDAMIDVMSTPGGGSTFTVTLHALPSPDGAPSRPVQSVSPPNRDLPINAS
jgi:two-component system, OmpR family, sensor kinase